MFKAIFAMGGGVGLALALAMAVACGPSGVGEGNECGGTMDDCGANLTCTPVEGRGHSYCCPAPEEASNYQNCHPVVQVDHTPR